MELVAGFLCVDKPDGMTSRAVVNRIERHVRPAKAGHAGTLDPMATGVLVVAVGRATKLISHVQRMEKRYAATFELGKTSDTEDITGEVVKHAVSKIPTLDEVTLAAESFLGEIMQRPPAYSALRVNGQRAHALARKGETVELKPRPIVIHSIDIVSYQYPKLELDVRCGSGTYVRSLGRDIGEALGCGGVMSALRRTAVGCFRIEESARLEDLQQVEAIEAHLQPSIIGTADLPQIRVNEEQKKLISFGTPIELDIVDSDLRNAKELVAITASGDLIAVLSKTGSRYKPTINFIAV